MSQLLPRINAGDWNSVILFADKVKQALSPDSDIYFNAANLGSTLDVTGATTLGSTLDVTGVATLSSDLSVGGDADITGDLSIDGTLELTGLTAGGVVYVNADNELTTNSNFTIDYTDWFQTITSTAGKQLRLAYDGSNYTDFKADSSGYLVITPSGGNYSRFTFMEESTYSRFNYIFAGSGGWGAELNLQRARNSLAIPLVVYDDDHLGALTFDGYDGTHYVNVAVIVADVDGTPSGDNVPGRLDFYTRPDGNDIALRLRIDNAGDFDFQSGALTTTGLGTFGNLDVDTLNFNGNVISDSTGTISLDDENLTTTGTGTFGELIDNGLTALRLTASDGSKQLVSSDLVNWVADVGSSNITVADDASGGITLDTVQDIGTGASPTFGNLTITSQIIFGSLSGGDLDVGNIAAIEVQSQGDVIAGGEITDGVASLESGSLTGLTDLTTVDLTVTDGSSYEWNLLDNANNNISGILYGIKAVNSAYGTQIYYRRSRGTISSPLYLDDADTIGTFNYGAWDESGSTWRLVGQFVVSADGDHSATNRGTYFRLRLVPNGSTTVGDYLECHTDLFTITPQVLFLDKVLFTQTDGNEYIDSLADGYMDYGATTAHRFNNKVFINGTTLGTHALEVIESSGNNLVLLRDTSNYTRLEVGADGGLGIIPVKGAGGVGNVSIHGNFDTSYDIGDSTGTINGLIIVNLNSSTIIGYQAIKNSKNEAVPYSSVFIGYQTGLNSNTNDVANEADYNTFVGYQCGVGAASPTYLTGQKNVGLGYQSLYYLSSGSWNTCLGYNTGRALTTGGLNVFVGYNAGLNQTTNSNRLIIDNQDRGSSDADELANCLIYGLFDAAVANQYLRINGILKSSYGAQLGDGGTTNYLDIASNGDITFNGSAGFYPVRLAQSAQPTPDTGELVIWRDTDDGKVYLVYNDTDSGVKQVEMT